MPEPAPAGDPQPALDEPPPGSGSAAGPVISAVPEGLVDRTAQVEDVAPGWVAPLFGALAALTVPWAVYLAYTLPGRVVTAHYRGAWVGFDIGLVLLLATTAYQAWRGSRQVAAAATATATMLVVDGWFDVLTTPRGPDLVLSVASAVLVELPLAALCLWIAHNVEKVVNRRLRQLARRAVRGPSRAERLRRRLPYRSG